MAFDLGGWLRFSFAWLRGFRWSARRAVIVLAYFTLFPLIELYVWTGLLLDHVLYPRFRRQPVRQPVFIIGNPRSGTTFLHRLLSRDARRYRTMKMWEVLLAPAICHRALVEGLATLDRWLGSPLRRRLGDVEWDWQRQNVMHEVSLREPEEDDYLLLHVWSALTIGLSAGLTDLAMPYTFFDTALPEKKRRRVMTFYRRCLQRHLHARGGGERRHYLAKNPALCPKLGTVLEFFPDARIIYLVRNPLEMIPSYVSMMEFTWEALGAPARDGQLADYVTGMAAHWYRYPLEVLDDLPCDRYAIVTYDDLIADPERTVRRIYDRIGFDVDPDFERVLREQSKQARGYRSRHRYRLEDLRLSRDRILEECRGVFERFGFDRDAGASPAADDRRPESRSAM